MHVDLRTCINAELKENLPLTLYWDFETKRQVASSILLIKLIQNGSKSSSRGHMQSLSKFTIKRVWKPFPIQTVSLSRSHFSNETWFKSQIKFRCISQLTSISFLSISSFYKNTYDSGFLYTYAGWPKISFWRLHAIFIGSVEMN